MSIGPGGIVGGAAGSQLPQVSGADVERSRQEMAHQSRETLAARRAAEAAGVGQTEQDELAADRDVDGRRLWETAQRAKEPHETAADEDRPGPPGNDPQRGTLLDLQG